MGKDAIPAVKLPEAGHDLLSDFQHDRKMSSMGDTIRYLLSTHPELKAFAKSDDLSLFFAMPSWGGNRRGEAKPAKSDE